MLSFTWEVADSVAVNELQNIPIKLLTMRSSHVPFIVRAHFATEDAVKIGAFFSQSVVITSQMPKEPPPGASGPNGRG